MKTTRRYDLALVVLLCGLAVLGQRQEWFSLIEDQTIGFRHQMRLAYGDPAALAPLPDVGFVNTDEAFFKAYKSFPLRRTDIGTIVRNVRALGARVAVVDMLMDFPSSYGEDPILAAALREAGNVLLVSQGEVKNGKMGRINHPTPVLDAAADTGYANAVSSSRLMTNLSRVKIYPEATGQPGGWPIAVKAVAAYLGVTPKLDANRLILGDRAVPLDESSRIAIDYPPLVTGTRFLSQTTGISANEFLVDLDAMDPGDREELATWVRDKIVLIGDTSDVSHDWFDTPVGSVYGVEIIGDTIATLLKGGPLQPLGAPLETAVALGMMALLVLLEAWVHSPFRRALGFFAIVGGFIATATVLYVSRGLIVPMSYILAALILGHLVVEFRQFILERRQRRQISRTFGQYIPAELVAEMSRTGQEVSVGGESREMTVLFSDVRGFTSISEGLAPQELTVLMNAFLSPMTRVIHQNHGTIDKYMGDAIMAFWGAPLTDPDHARHAVQAAMAMGKTMEDLSVDFVARGWKPIKVGIGLNSGVMSVGNMGSDFRLAYTVMGDAVNLGSRIESLTKQYGVGAMISEFTRAAVPDLICREIDRVRVKGKDQPVHLFEPLGFEGEVSADTLAVLARHHAALAAFRAQDWATAKAGFQALTALEPNRMIYTIYLDRIAHFEAEPPGTDWDGVYTHKEK